jgi:hypothetical protein
VYSVFCILYSLFVIFFYSVFCILYSVFCILYSVFCILYSVFCILYSVFCVLCSVFCILYSVVYVVSFMYMSFRAHPYCGSPSPSGEGGGGGQCSNFFLPHCSPLPHLLYVMYRFDAGKSIRGQVGGVWALESKAFRSL